MGYIHRRGYRPLTLGYKLIDAGAEVIAMFTRLPREICRDIMHASTFRAINEAGLREMPGEETPLEVRYRIVLRSTVLVAEDLERRRISPQIAARVRDELDAFYRGVRGIAPPERSDRP